MGAEHKKPNDLKRLGFVHRLADQTYSKTTDLACYAYSVAKPYVPTSVDNTLHSVTQRVQEVSKPYVDAGVGTGMKGLSLADSTVDNAVSSAHSYWSGALNFQKQAHEKNHDYYLSAKDTVLKSIEDGLSFFRERGIAGVVGSTFDAARHRLESLTQMPHALYNETEQLRGKLAEAWGRISSTGPVKSVVDMTKPTVDFAWSKYMGVHDYIVTRPVYGNTVETSTHIIHKVQEMPVYKTLKNHLYPIVAPIADPAYDTVSKSPMVNDMLNHLKPRSSAVH